MLAAISFAGYSQTNTNPPAISGPAADLIQFMGKGSNWLTAVYGIRADNQASKYDWGAGIALGYRLNDYVVPTMRIDWLKNQLWMPSADLQLQAPITLFNKVTLIPFGFTGIATPIGGAGDNNGSVVGLFGAGAAIRLDFLGGMFKKMDLVADYELWTGGGFNNSKQIRGGLVYKF